MELKEFLTSFWADMACVVVVGGLELLRRAVLHAITSHVFSTAAAMQPKPAPGAPGSIPPGMPRG